MATKDIFVSSAFLASKQKTEKMLFTGKVERDNFPEGFFFYIIELKNKQKSSKALRKILDLIKNNTISPKNVQGSFELFLENLNVSLNEIAKHGESEWVGCLNAVIGLIHGNQIALTQTGKICGYIDRKGKVSTITEPIKSSDHHPLKTFTDVTSGKISDGDSLIFGNLDFFDNFPLNKSREIIAEHSPKEAIIEIGEYFKKARFFNANAIIIGASKTAFSGKELPEFFYVDEPEESLIEKAKKHLLPIYQEKLKPSLAYIKNHSKEQSQIIVDKSKEAWKNDLAPAAKNLIEKKAAKASPTPKTPSPASPAQSTTPKEKLNARIKVNFKELFKKKPVKRKISFKTNLYQKMKDGKDSIKKMDYKLLFQNIWRSFFNPKNRKYLYAVLVVFFMVFSFMKLKANNSDKSDGKKEQELVLSFDKATEKYSKTKEDIALGRATNQLADLEDALAQSKKAEASKQTAEKAKDLSKQIQVSIDSLSGSIRIYKDQNPIPFNKNIKKIVLTGQEVYGLDDGGKVYTFNTNDNEARLVASIGKPNSNLKDLAYSDSVKNVFFITEENKIIELDANSKANGELKLDEGWEPITAFETYTTNLYILDSYGDVWKHTKKDGGYNKGSIYVDGKKNNLKDVVDLAVDGNVFVLKKNGEVNKFVKGAADPFALKEIKGSDPKLISPSKIVTDSDSTFIYILDSQNRIVKFNKSGEFVSQYYLDGSTIDDFVVNSRVQKMWILSDGNMYEIKL